MLRIGEELGRGAFLDHLAELHDADAVAELRETLGMSVLFITHDLAVVAQLCDRVGVMKLGEMVEEGTTTELFADPKHAYTRQLLRAREMLDGPMETAR